MLPHPDLTIREVLVFLSSNRCRKTLDTAVGFFDSTLPYKTIHNLLYITAGVFKFLIDSLGTKFFVSLSENTRLEELMVDQNLDQFS